MKSDLENENSFRLTKNHKYIFSRTNGSSENGKKKSKNKVYKLARQLKNINYIDRNLNKIGNIGGKIMGEMI